MSSNQPHQATTHAAGYPQFPLVFRGYDRELVDARLAGLVEQLERERRRSDDAERALHQFKLDVKDGRAQVPAWFTNVGDEVDRLVKEAGTAAAKLLAEAGRHIQTAIEAAEAQAADLLKAAEAQVGKVEQTARETLADAQTERVRLEAAAATAAEEVRAQADRDTKALLAKANEEVMRASDHAARERLLLEAESERLTTLRQAMVEQLGQVYAPLGLTLVDTRHDLQPGAEDGYRSDHDKPDPSAATDGGSVDGQRPVLPDARSEYRGEAEASR